MTSAMADIVRAGGWHDCGVIRIGPRLKAFAWGQTDAIPRMLGLGAVEGPVAEAWFGAHESAPSPLAGGGDLATHIAADPGATVGEERLPYLLKILAIATPLSIQGPTSYPRGYAPFYPPGYAAERSFAAASRRSGAARRRTSAVCGAVLQRCVTTVAPPSTACSPGRTTGGSCAACTRWRGRRRGCRDRWRGRTAALPSPRARCRNTCGGPSWSRA